MFRKSHLEQLEEKVTPLAEANGLEIVDMEYLSSNAILRIYIDRIGNESGNIDVDDCASFSRTVSDVIDVEFNDLDFHYNLEVSSPGIERVIKKERDFKRFQGSSIRVKTFSPINGQRNFTGKLERYENNTLFLGLEDSVLEIKKINLAKTNLIFEEEC